jgi:hypothetical protein
MLIMVKVPNRGDLTFAAGENLSYIGHVKLAVASKARIEEVDFQLCKAGSSAELEPETLLRDLTTGDIVKLSVKLIGECVLQSVLLCSVKEAFGQFASRRSGRSLA